MAAKMGTTATRNGPAAGDGEEEGHGRVKMSEKGKFVLAKSDVTGLGYLVKSHWTVG